MDIQVGDFIKTSGGIIGKVARVVGELGMRFYRVQMYTRMHYGVTATRGLAFVAHSEVVDVKKATATVAAEATPIAV